MENEGPVDAQDTEVDDENPPPAQRDQPGANRPEVLNNASTSSTVGGRPWCANVIANERQITNEPAAPPRATTENTPIGGTARTSSTSRRAAEEDEHVVVKGERGGASVELTRVCTGNYMANAAPSSTCSAPEHHGDPLDGYDIEGDVVMEVEDINEEPHRMADDPPATV